jgi:uncharacterized protein YbjT (DUF2867 family)
MKVFVAGATGAIGRPLIAALVAAKHEVIGMTSKGAGMQALRAMGAEGVFLNALDAAAVNAEIERIRPDVIIDELTSLPKRYTPQELRAAAPRDRQLRLERGRQPTQSGDRSGPDAIYRTTHGLLLWPGPSSRVGRRSTCTRRVAGGRRQCGHVYAD